MYVKGPYLLFALFFVWEFPKLLLEHVFRFCLYVCVYGLYICGTTVLFINSASSAV